MIGFGLQHLLLEQRMAWMPLFMDRRRAAAAADRRVRRSPNRWGQSAPPPWQRHQLGRQGLGCSEVLELELELELVLMAGRVRGPGLGLGLVRGLGLGLVAVVRPRAKVYPFRRGLLLHRSRPH
jgi:hypothetical protein